MMMAPATRKKLSGQLLDMRARLPAAASATPISAPSDPARTDLGALLASCRDQARDWPQPSLPPLRSLHHLACTGGTLIAQCLGAQPNTQLLSEVDPLSRIGHQNRFVPTDMIGLARLASRASGEETMIKMFLASLKVLYDDARQTATALILRDHAHSQFTYGPDVGDRPSLHEILQPTYSLCSLVTVRHPVDSFVSLTKSKWLHFTPATFEEYCRRYLIFLDRHAGIEILRYEEFVADPEPHMQRACEVLELTYSPKFQHLHSAMPLSGDSGRSGHRIRPRPRREIPATLAKEAAQSVSYAALCRRLGYATDLGQPPLV